MVWHVVFSRDQEESTHHRVLGRGSNESRDMARCLQGRGDNVLTAGCHLGVNLAAGVSSAARAGRGATDALVARCSAHCVWGLRK